MSGFVQVFGCLHDEAILALSAGYGDLKSTPVVASARHSGASG